MDETLGKLMEPRRQRVLLALPGQLLQQRGGAVALRGEGHGFDSSAGSLPPAQARRRVAKERAEDELYGDGRGDELAPEFSTSAGWRGWLREAKKRLEAERLANQQPIPRDRPKRVKQAKRRLDEELWTEVRANDAYERYRARGRMRNGRRIGVGHSVPNPYAPPETREGRVNVTDPDSKVVNALRGWIQGYNAQAVSNEKQIILAAEIDNVGADF